MPELRGLTPQHLNYWRRRGFLEPEQMTDTTRFSYTYTTEEVEKIKRIWSYLKEKLPLQRAYKRAVKDLGLPLYSHQTETAPSKHRDANNRIGNYEGWLPHLTEREHGETFFNSCLVEITQGRFNGLNYLVMTFYNPGNLIDAVAELTAVPKLNDGKLNIKIKTRGEEGNKLRLQLLDALGDVDEITFPRAVVRAIREHHPDLMVSRVIHGNHKYRKYHQPWDRMGRNKRILNTLTLPEMNRLLFEDTNNL